MATIVLSYRREDSKWIAGRIFDRLENHYGKGQVFMDIDAIPVGIDFRDHIRATLDRCDILVAVIGPQWLPRDEAGQPRHVDETDWVRIEIEAALNKKIPVVPVLIDQSRMPKPDDLPESMRIFAFRQAATVDSGVDFRAHMDRLIRSMDGHLAQKSVGAPTSALNVATTAPHRQDAPPMSAVSPPEPEIGESARIDAAPAVRRQFRIAVLIGVVLVATGLAAAGIGVPTFASFSIFFGLILMASGTMALLLRRKDARQSATPPAAPSSP